MKQTSIEWLIDQLPIRIVNQYMQEIDRAKKMHKLEVTNCNHLEISDEEIEKAAEMFWGGDGGDETNKRVWKLGNKWYREQTKQRQNGNK